jgi:hypothetical protein
VSSNSSIAITFMWRENRPVISFLPPPGGPIAATNNWNIHILNIVTYIHCHKIHLVHIRPIVILYKQVQFLFIYIARWLFLIVFATKYIYLSIKWINKLLLYHLFIEWNVYIHTTYNKSKA